MIRVRIASHLFENCLKSGYKTGYLIEVMQGLPFDCQLVNAEYGTGHVLLYFSQPRVPDDQIEELNIVLRSIQATPVELETVPVPKQKSEDVAPMVERTIG